MGRRWHADVARRADLEIQLVVGPNGQELPAMGLVLRQIVVDEDRLRRVVEIILDLLDLGDFRQLRDVQRAALEGEAVRPIESRLWSVDLRV